MGEDLLPQALQAVASSVNSDDYLQVVGADNQQLLRERLERVNVCLSATPGSDRPGKQSRALYSLARECIDQAAVVDRDLPDAAEEASGGRWDPRIAVAEAAANSLAAFAVSMQPEASKASADLLEHLSLDLSYLSVHIFNGLCHSGGAPRPQADARRDRTLLALQAVCAWGLAAIGRTVGYSSISALIIWEWARSDAVWASTLVKGLLLSSAREGLDLPFVVLPGDLPELQAAVFAATTGLTSPTVAFAGDAGEGDGTIAARNEDLIRHRVELASAVVSCQLPQVLVATAARSGFLGTSGLSAFFVAMLQPELAGASLELASSSAAEAMSEVLLGAASSTGADTISQARAASAALGQQLRCCSEVLWDSLSQVPSRCSGCQPASFLADCVSLAHYVPPSAQSFGRFCRALVDGDALADEAALLAALCLLAANAGLVPGAGSPLDERLPSVASASRQAVAARWERWRGPVRMEELGQWARLLEVAWTPPPAAPRSDSPASPKAAASPPPAPPRPSPGRGSVLQELLRDAPAEFRCALSGQLMMDPVESPGGQIFDRAALVSAIGPQSGVCPLTGSLLAVGECRRLPSLRKKITFWVREHRARCAPEACSR